MLCICIPVQVSCFGFRVTSCSTSYHLRAEVCIVASRSGDKEQNQALGQNVTDAEVLEARQKQGAALFVTVYRHACIITFRTGRKMKLTKERPGWNSREHYKYLFCNCLRSGSGITG